MLNKLDDNEVQEQTEEPTNLSGILKQGEESTELPEVEKQTEEPAKILNEDNDQSCEQQS